MRPDAAAMDPVAGRDGHAVAALPRTLPLRIRLSLLVACHRTARSARRARWLVERETLGDGPRESVIVGGFYCPTVSVVDSLRAGTLMREAAIEAGALTVSANTEVLDIEVAGGRVTGLRTSRGDFATEVVVIACGVWSPRLARTAGASIPLTPAVHQMIDIGPVPRFAGAKSAIEHPIVRDMDTNMYERQDGTGLEVGSYAHRPILHDPDEIPSIEEAALSPTELPFTEDDFVQQMEHALELMPEIVGDESVGIKYAINGLLSLTPDGLPVLGETPEVGGLWSAAAVWVKEGPGVGRALAEWMVEGEPEIDLQASDVARFHEPQKTVAHVRARASEGFNKTYGIVHPAEQWASSRRVRLSPFNERERELGAVFYETAGWERPHWYDSNRGLLDEFDVPERDAEWDARWWSPIINAEHLAMRERAAIFDLTAFCVFDIVGPGALESVQRVSMRQMDVALGKVVYTPVLTPRGGFRSDLTIMRLGDEHFRVVTGGAHGMADLKWFRDHLVEDGIRACGDGRRHLRERSRAVRRGRRGRRRPEGRPSSRRCRRRCPGPRPRCRRAATRGPRRSRQRTRPPVRRAPR